MVTHNPFHRSGRAAFPHPAPASGDDAKSPQWIGVTDAGRRQPVGDEAQHSGPANTAGLTAPRQGAVPEPSHSKPKLGDCRAVHRHSVVAGVTANHRAQPLPHDRNGVVQAQERREPHRSIFVCRSTYPFQRTGRACPARRPGRVLLARVPVGQAPSLHLFRRRSPGFVRGLHRYPGLVRLPVSVHHRRVASDFPTRPAVTSAADEHRISRFSCEVFPDVHRVSARAGSRCISQLRCLGRRLPLLLTASAPRRKVASRLNTWPERAPVNASKTTSRAPPHDSGAAWVAGPSPYDSFIQYTSPVYPGARGDVNELSRPAPIFVLWTVSR